MADHRGSSLLLSRRAALLAGAAAVASRPAWAQKTGKPLRVGLCMQSSLQLGRDARDGLQMAITEMNGAGGISGRKLEMVFADETDNPEGAINAARKLLSDERVDVLMGHLSSGNFLAQLPQVAEARIVTLITAAASVAITQKVRQDYDKYKYIFRVTINADRQADAMLDFMKNMVVGELGMKRIALLVDNSRWSQDVVKVLKKGAGDTGAEITTVEIVAPDTLDFSTSLSRIKSSGAQFIITVLTYAKTDVLAKQWSDARFPVTYGGMDSLSMDDAFFKRVDGKNMSEISAVYGMRVPITPKTIPYYDKFTAQFGRTPGYQAWTVDNALHLYAEAVERAKGFEADKVVPELEKTKYVGVDGIVEFDRNHDALSGPGRVGWLFAQWDEGGKRNPVWPANLRTGPMVKPGWL